MLCYASGRCAVNRHQKMMPYTRNQETLRSEEEKGEIGDANNTGKQWVLRNHAPHCTGTMDSSSSTGFKTVPQVGAQANYVPNTTSSRAEKKIDTVSGPAGPPKSARGPKTLSLISERTPLTISKDESFSGVRLRRAANVPTLAGRVPDDVLAHILTMTRFECDLSPLSYSLVCVADGWPYCTGGLAPCFGPMSISKRQPSR